MNPADQAIKIINTDFASGAHKKNDQTSAEHLDTINAAWTRLEPEFQQSEESSASPSIKGEDITHLQRKGNQSSIHKTGILIQRNLLNYRRNILAFGIRSKFPLVYVRV